ncbi:MAG: N-acetylmuramoyl-L-alanine amidase [Pseudorhodoplanes sp.]|uniref:N-acetylmuramoyl-L-alanine amidase n=1 Tax=Pseudorhodoplanes sp. TaxID=1934341 RepID=UPI003D0A89AF
MLCGPSSALAQGRATAALPVATDIRVAGDDQQTRLIMDLTANIGVRAFTLADPYRVVVDIPQTVFQLPPHAGESGRGLVKAYRYGLVMAGGSRLVIDVSRPVRIEKAVVLQARGGEPARLVLDLSATDREAFLRHLALDRTALRGSNAGATASRPQDRQGDPRPLVVIDPGHGGPDTGTKVGGGDVMEKNVVLDFSLTLRDQLEKSGRYRVVMTRTDDSFIPLAERVKFARHRQAQLFISVHADALPKSEGDTQGATVYTLSETASDAEAAKLAEAENRSDVIAGIDLTKEPDDVADILFDLAHRETKTFSHAFARLLVGEMKNAVRLHKKPLKSAGFVVLKAPDVPSVLIELGYMTNRQDLRLLTSETWRARAAGTMVQAVDQFFRTRIAGAGASAGRR